MTNMEQLQVVVSEVQAARSQVANFNAQLNELELTISAVKDQPEDILYTRIWAMF